MIKVMKLNDSQFSLLSKDGSTKSIKKILGLSTNKEYGIGDATVITGIETQQKDVFKANWNGEDRFYVVITPIDHNLAFCYTIYPIN